MVENAEDAKVYVEQGKPGCPSRPSVIQPLLRFYLCLYVYILYVHVWMNCNVWQDISCTVLYLYLFIFIYLFIYLFLNLLLAVLGLCFCARAFSSCGKRGPLLIAVRGPLTIAASRCGAQAPDAQAQ